MDTNIHKNNCINNKLFCGAKSQEILYFDGMEHLGARIKVARKARNMSQGALGDAIGMTQQAIGSLEKGATESTTKLNQIAKVLDVDLTWLETGEGQMEMIDLSEPQSKNQRSLKISKGKILLQIDQEVTVAQFNEIAKILELDDA